MKKLILLAVTAFGLAQTSPAADLLWAPTDANWDLSSQNWTNTSTLLRAPFAQRDNVLLDDTGLAFPNPALGANLLSPSNVVVDTSSQYLITTASTGKLTNVCTLTKKGSGTLIIDNNAVITNSVSIESGTLQIGNASSRGTLGSGFPGFTAPVTVSSTLAYNRTSALNFTNDLSGSGTLSIPSTATGAWNLYGNNSMYAYTILHNGNMALLFGNAASIGTPSSIQSTAAAGVNVRLQMGGGVTLPDYCSINATLATGTTSTRFSVMSQAGVNTVNSPIYLAGGGYTDSNNRPWANLYAQGAGSTVTVNSPVADSDPTGNPFVGNFYLRGTGAGAVGYMYGTINLPSAQLLKDEASTWTLASTGNKATITYIANGRLNMGVPNALPVAQLTVVSPAVLDLAGFDQQAGPLWGSGSITNSSISSDVLLTLTNGGAYTGSIKDSGTTKIALKLLNPGAPTTQQLTGDPSYHGATTLELATAIALGNSGLPNSTPIEMGDGSSLDLSTKTDNTFTLGAAQTLKGNGTVHIKGNFINQGTVSLNVSKTSGVVTAAKLTVDASYSLTYGGTLYLELTGEDLTTSDTLPLFSSTGGYAGTFATIVPATPAAGLLWNTNTLTTDGILRIAAPSSIPTTPTNITCTVVGGGTQLEIAWPQDYTGWKLQGQTNSLSVGISNTWFDVPDSATTNRVYMPIDPANGSVFYRLYYQP
jgi:fibronectin-binding autotransporter adhesin